MGKVLGKAIEWNNSLGFHSSQKNCSLTQNVKGKSIKSGFKLLSFVVSTVKSGDIYTSKYNLTLIEFSLC